MQRLAELALDRDQAEVVGPVQLHLGGILDDDDPLARRELREAAR